MVILLQRNRENPAKRRLINAVVPVALPDLKAWDPSLPLVSPDTEVICLSQTVRTLGDADVGDRDALVVDSESKSIDWEQCSLWSKIHTGHLDSMETIISVEAFKSLEPIFTAGMKKLLSMGENDHMGELFQTHMDIESRAMGFPTSTEKWWYEYVPFGVFCSALIAIQGLVAGSDAASVKKTLLTESGEFIFTQVLEEGIEILEERSARHLKPEIIEKTLETVKGEANHRVILQQFANLTMKRTERNQASHPFAQIGQYDLAAAIDTLASFLQRSKADTYREVGYLCMLKLLVDEKEYERKRADEEVSRAAMHLLVLEEVKKVKENDESVDETFNNLTAW